MMNEINASPNEVTDPIETFLTEQRLHGKSDRTLVLYKRVLRDFETHLANSRGAAVDSANRTDCMEWVHRLRKTQRASTIATYATTVNRFYGYMNQIGVLDSNPMSLVVQEMEESINVDPMRRDISIPEMREFIQDINHPLDLALTVMFVKTGIRVGELCNLDLRDVCLHQPNLDLSWEIRGPLTGHPDTLFVDSDPARGREYNGETRYESNKRKRPTLIPIDQELYHVLVQWLAVRPDARSVAQPLFVSTASDWGDRLSGHSVRQRLRQYTEDVGWYNEGADSAENVTPHYFRHFFTTHMRDRIGDRGIVKYLRGDVADDIIDTYTHNWGDRVRARYEANIYSVL